MKELTPEQKKAKLDMLTPDKVAAEIEKGSTSEYQGDEMEYLIELKHKYEEIAELKGIIVARADVLATNRGAGAAEESNRLKKAEIRWAWFKIVISLLAIVVAVLLGWYFQPISGQMMGNHIVG